MVAKTVRVWKYQPVSLIHSGYLMGITVVLGAIVGGCVREGNHIHYRAASWDVLYPGLLESPPASAISHIRPVVYKPSLI